MPAVRQRRRKRSQRLPWAALSLAVGLLAAGLALWHWFRPAVLPGERVSIPEDVQVDYLTPNPYSRPQLPLEEIHGIVIHYVGNPGTSAQANRSYFEGLAAGTDGVYASAHFIVGLEGEVVQCIPLTEEAYASNSRNADTIGIEVCHPDETGEFSAITYDRLVDLTADLCLQLKLTAEDVIRHYDVTGKNCPKYYVENPEAWDAFRQAVTDRISERRADGQR